MDLINRIVLHLSIENEEIENIQFSENINFPDNQTVDELVVFIENTFNISVESIKKNFNELPRNQPLNNLGIVNEDNIVVIQKLKCVHVYDILYKGERKEHRYSNMERVSSLQERIARSLNVDRNSLMLFYNKENFNSGDQVGIRKFEQNIIYLEDNNQIVNYDLGNDPTIIFCVVRNFGDLEELGDRVAEGQYSQVYAARIVGNDTVIAIKKYTVAEQYKPVLRELISFAKLEDHPRIVNLLGFFKDEIYFYIAMEYMKKGSLHSYVKINGPVNEELIREWSKQILEGLAYLHKNRIIHCDLKSSNILLDDNLNIKISGFSLSKYLAGANSTIMSEGFMQSKPGTCNFMAPEVLIDQRITRKSDVWSFGAVLIELVTGQQPFHGMESINIILKIADEQTIQYHPREGMSENLQDFINRCLIGDRKRRFSVEQLLAHEFLR